MLPTLEQVMEVANRLRESEDSSLFIGWKENEYFEAKPSGGYSIENAAGRYELAKDVSAFANSEGGLLVIGLATLPLRSENTDVVSEIDPIKTDDKYLESLKGVVESHIHPHIQNIEYTPIEVGESGKIYLIKIPPQHENLKYFLVKNAFIENKVFGILVGIIERKGSHNLPSSPDSIHKLIRRGNRPYEDRFENLEKMIIDIRDSVESIKSAQTNLLEGRKNPGENLIDLLESFIDKQNKYEET